MNSVQALWRRRDLVRELASSDFRSRYRRLGFGIIWAAVQPLITGLVIAAVFSLLGRGNGWPFPFALYVLTGTMPWQVFIGCMMGGTLSLLDQQQIVQRVRLPRAALPTSTILANAYTLGFICGSLLLLIGILAPGRLTHLWLLPVAVFMILALPYGLALTFSTLQVRYRDIEPLLQTLTAVWFWTTPIIYELSGPRSLLNDNPVVQNLLRANPMTGIIGLFRGAFLAMPVDGWALWSSVGWTAFFLVLGWNVFKRRESTVADFI